MAVSKLCLGKWISARDPVELSRKCSDLRKEDQDKRRSSNIVTLPTQKRIQLTVNRPKPIPTPPPMQKLAPTPSMSVNITKMHDAQRNISKSAAPQGVAPTTPPHQKANTTHTLIFELTPLSFLKNSGRIGSTATKIINDKLQQIENRIQNSISGFKITGIAYNPSLSTIEVQLIEKGSVLVMALVAGVIMSILGTAGFVVSRWTHYKGTSIVEHRKQSEFESVVNAVNNAKTDEEGMYWRGILTDLVDEREKDSITNNNKQSSALADSFDFIQRIAPLAIIFQLVNSFKK